MNHSTFFNIPIWVYVAYFFGGMVVGMSLILLNRLGIRAEERRFAKYIRQSEALSGRNRPEYLKIADRYDANGLKRDGRDTD